MSELGHNSVDNAQLQSIVERIERAEAEKAEVQQFISEIYKEAGGNGFDAKQLRRVVRERKRDRDRKAEEDAIFELYMRALGEAP